ncbi:hypothetical protein C8R46DRAFT_1030660 [Mycena filopes]|nr:hypothetical protein C8R46DRAFT_1030660 [Mycena filopes]
MKERLALEMEEEGRRVYISLVFGWQSKYCISREGLRKGPIIHRYSSRIFGIIFHFRVVSQPLRIRAKPLCGPVPSRKYAATPERRDSTTCWLRVSAGHVCLLSGSPPSWSLLFVVSLSSQSAFLLIQSSAMGVSLSVELYRVSNFVLPTRGSVAVAVPHVVAITYPKNLLPGNLKLVAVVGRTNDRKTQQIIPNLIPRNLRLTRANLGTLSSRRSVRSLVKFSLPGSLIPSWSMVHDLMLIAEESTQQVPSGSALGLSLEMREAEEGGALLDPIHPRQYTVFDVFAPAHTIAPLHRLFLPFNFVEAVEIVRLVKVDDDRCSFECTTVDTGEMVLVWVSAQYVDVQAFHRAASISSKLVAVVVAVVSRLRATRRWAVFSCKTNHGCLSSRSSNGLGKIRIIRPATTGISRGHGRRPGDSRADKAAKTLTRSRKRVEGNAAYCAFKEDTQTNITNYTEETARQST